MWSESILVNAQISGALVHHLADDVYFHLQKTRWGYCYLLTCLNITDVSAIISNTVKAYR